MNTFSATLAQNQRVGPATFVLHLEGCAALRACEPGQFVMLRGEWGRDPLLPRAFSIMSVVDDRAEILAKVVGKGTALLAGAKPGSRFQILGPLGTRFPAPTRDRKDWLVAGGVGLAPLLFHAERAVREGFQGNVRLFYGGRRADDLVLGDRLRALGVTLTFATEDGSSGARGRVTDALAPELAPDDGNAVLMACGPDPMLRAVATLAKKHGNKTYLSLEGEMACGIGVCLGCAVACATKPYRYTCKDGPVMDLDELRGPYA